MRKLIQISFLLAIFTFVASSVQAQKFGVVDSDAILANMPKVKSAQANLDVLRKQLQTKGQNMVADFQKKYQELQTKQQQGLISQKDLEVEAKKLETRQAEIAKFEQDMVKQLQDRESKELKPVFDEVNNAIQAVAKENGYQFIFEKRTLLYSDASVDVSPMVKAKLGLN